MLEPTTAEFLEGGCSLIVGGVHADGSPHATRAWGLQVLDADEGRIRLLVDARDDPRRSDAGEPVFARGRRIAITSADVPTLRSVQFKGRVLDVEDPTDTDRSRRDRYCRAFFEDIHLTDGTDRDILDRFAPVDVVAFTVQLEDSYDQTPGPTAGASMTGAP